MRVTFNPIVLAVAVIIVSLAQGADLEPTKVGDTKPTWKDLPGVDGRQHSLADLDSKAVVVVATTCNHCPIALEYFDRLKKFANQHCGRDGKVALVAISLSDLETDKLPRMIEFAARKELNFPYLHDSSQQVGKALGATVTPQFFVLDRSRTLVYRGAWDDSINAANVKNHYVEDAVAAALAGKLPAESDTKARGCPINYRK